MWQANEPLVVQWEYFVSADAVNFELYEGGTAFSETIYDAGWPNSGEFIWAVPETIKLTTYAIRMTNAADASELFMSPVFTISDDGAGGQSDDAESYTVSGSTLAWFNIFALIVVIILIGIGYFNHDEHERLPKVAVFFMIWSAPDLVLDCLWVHARNKSSGQVGYFIAGVMVLVVTSVLNVIGTNRAIQTENEKGHFDREKFLNKCFGVPYPFIAILCFTNPDCLMLLPWKYNEENKAVTDSTGFPSRSLLLISFLRLLEDTGQAIVQGIYLSSSQGDDALTIYSLIFSFVGIAYVFICKIVVYITSDADKGKVHPLMRSLSG